MSNKDNFVEVADIDEEEEYSEMGVYLKENYDLQDFLNYTKTRDILNKNSRWVYENKMDDIIAAFYKGEVDFNKADNSTLFANEQNYKRLGIFQAMVYTCLEPKYDLEIYGQTAKIDLKKRENLYQESRANGLIRKLQRFKDLKSLLRG